MCFSKKSEIPSCLKLKVPAGPKVLPFPCRKGSNSGGTLTGGRSHVFSLRGGVPGRPASRTLTGSLDRGVMCYPPEYLDVCASPGLPQKARRTECGPGSSARAQDGTGRDGTGR